MSGHELRQCVCWSRNEILISDLKNIYILIRKTYKNKSILLFSLPKYIIDYIILRFITEIKESIICMI